MADGTFKIAGLKELGERMRNLTEQVNTKIARSATASAAGAIRKKARAKAPIADEDYVVEGTKVQKGNLPKQIVTKRRKSSETSLTSEHVVTVRGKRKYGYASRIGVLQEFGTVKMAAQPFLRPAFDEGKEEAAEAMKKRLEAGIKKAGA